MSAGPVFEVDPRMLVVRGYQNVPDEARGGVLAIGNFDGVHRGHQTLLATAARIGLPHGACHGVLTFDPHPRMLFQPEQPHFQLTPLPMKLDLLARYGATLACVLPFDRALAGLTASAFIADVLVAGLGVRHIVVGDDFAFGKGRSGTVATLRAAADGGAFGLTVVEPVVAASGGIVASSAVRAALAAGEVDGAAALLGHWWRVDGVVRGGAKRGTGMGYPTANITLPAAVGLGHGIYAARVYVDGACHAGAAYLGTRPTFDNGAPVLEIFLLDFDGDLYGRTITVELIVRLRGDRAFPDMAALVAQMDQDVAACRRHLAALEAQDPYRWPPQPAV